jgi:hypothetical protein
VPTIVGVWKKVLNPHFMPVVLFLPHKVKTIDGARLIGMDAVIFQMVTLRSKLIILDIIMRVSRCSVIMCR